MNEALNALLTQYPNLQRLSLLFVQRANYPSAPPHPAPVERARLSAACVSFQMNNKPKTQSARAVFLFLSLR